MPPPARWDSRHSVPRAGRGTKGGGQVVPSSGAWCPGPGSWSAKNGSGPGRRLGNGPQGGGWGLGSTSAQGDRDRPPHLGRTAARTRGPEPSPDSSQHTAPACPLQRPAPRPAPRPTPGRAGPTPRPPQQSRPQHRTGPGLRLCSVFPGNPIPIPGLQEGGRTVAPCGESTSM